MDYFEIYLRAIRNPMPELKESFQAELEFLKSNTTKADVVLDIGCGAARPAKELAPFVKKIIGIDNDKKILEIGRQESSGIKNVELVYGNVLSIDFPDSTFDISYSAYNMIGSFDQKEQQILINEMARVTKKGGKVINFTWRRSKEVNEILKRYYPLMGFEVVSIDDEKTVTTAGTFERISKKQLEQYYKIAKLKEIEFHDVGPVFLAVVGTK